jgi:hypothetical protein
MRLGWQFSPKWEKRLRMVWPPSFVILVHLFRSFLIAFKSLYFLILRSNVSVVTKTEGFYNMASPETFQPPPPGEEMMNALRFHGQNDLRYEKIPIPQVKAGHVKVKPAWVGICGTGTSKVESS